MVTYQEAIEMAKKPKMLTIQQASALSGLDAQHIRELIKRDMVDFGYAVSFKTDAKRKTYKIIPAKFFKWLGREVPTEWR